MADITDTYDSMIRGRTKLTHYNHCLKVDFTPIITCLNVPFLPQKFHSKDIFLQFLIPSKSDVIGLLESHEFSFP